MSRFKRTKNATGGELSIHQLGVRFQAKLVKEFGCGAKYYTNIFGRWVAVLNSSDKEAQMLLDNLFEYSKKEDVTSDEEIKALVDDIIVHLKSKKYNLIPWTKTEMRKYDSKISLEVTEITPTEIHTEETAVEEVSDKVAISVEAEEASDEEEISIEEFSEEEATKLASEIDIDLDSDEPSSTEEVEIPPSVELTEITSVYEEFFKFFTEVAFKPSVRMIDTISRMPIPKDGENYIRGYLELINHPDKDIIVPKLKSTEFQMIWNKMRDIYEKISISPINNRLEIWYGPNGTGKTYSVINRYHEEYPDIGVMACSSSMSSQEDLLQVFDFLEDGKPQFKDSPLTEAIKKDCPVILEEARLMQQSAFAFLQNLLDSKEYVDTCRGRLNIGPNFKVIMTLNLEVNGIVYELPEPIVDRAQMIVKKEMDAETASAIIWNRKEVK